MEQSAFEALMIGVYVFIFIAALTAGVLLMSNIIDMVNFANQQAIVGMNGTLAETVGVVDERLYTGAQLVTYYRKQIERTAQEKELQYNFKVKLSENGQENSLQDFIQSGSVSSYLNEKFVLRYKGKQAGKDLYVFVKYQNEVEGR